MTEEIYPMPSFPVLTVSDLAASAQWYQDVLGFTHIFTMPGPGGAPVLVHLRWLKYADLLVAKPRDPQELSGPLGLGVSLNFSMLDRFTGSVDVLAQQARQHGANIVSGPLDQPWNVRELTLLDPDGYRLVFTTPIDPGLSFDRMLGQVTGGA